MFPLTPPPSTPKELQGAKDLKEYVSYQRAVAQACRFSLDKTLVKYLTFLLGFESKNKQLFMAISQTLIDVMNLNHASVAIPEIADDELRTSLVNVLYRFYEGAAKNWYKNAKTKLYSFKIQVFLYSLFDIQKMDLCKKGGPFSSSSSASFVSHNLKHKKKTSRSCFKRCCATPSTGARPSRSTLGSCARCRPSSRAAKAARSGR